MRNDLSRGRRTAPILALVLYVAASSEAQQGNASVRAAQPSSSQSSGYKTDKEKGQASDTDKTSGKMKGEFDDLDEKLKKKKKEERKPDFQIIGVKTSPFDLSVPYFKQNHWTLFLLDMIANNADETVEIRSGHEPVLETAHELRYRRLTHLRKEEQRLVRLPMLIPRKSREIELAIYRPGAVLPITPPGVERYPCIRLEPHQFLIVVLSPEPDSYSFVSGLRCVQAEVETDGGSETQRYFHVVRPGLPTKPLVADNALAWTTTSHVIWDDLDPALLSLRQQEAMIDWLHWGGQLLVSGGSAAAKLQQSFLAPYLPADVSPIGGRQVTELKELSQRFRPTQPTDPSTIRRNEIIIKPDKPVYLAELEPRADLGAKAIAKLNDDFPLVVQRPVGRGRVLMAAFSLDEPDLVAWSGYDDMWRRVLLGLDPPSAQQRGIAPAGRIPLDRLSRVRYLARDLGASARRPAPEDTSQFGPRPLLAGYGMGGETEQLVDTIAEWRDDTAVPNVARQTLRQATGIEIPPPRFVLGVAAWYLVALVPINYLVCRYGLRRPELAWLAAPVIVAAFALGIVTLAQQNVGFTMTSREIDVVEAFADYPRVHVSRFTCVYSSSRRRCEFRYENPLALAMPMAMGSFRRGQNIERLALDWDISAGSPVALGRYEIHPRSIGMVRAEEMLAASGDRQQSANRPPGFYLRRGPAAGQWTLENDTAWELWDCHLVTGGDPLRLDDLRPGERLEFPPAADSSTALQPAGDSAGRRERISDGPGAGHSRLAELGDLQPHAMLDLLEGRAFGSRVQLIGWMPRPVEGQQIDPAPAGVVGFTVFAVHLDVNDK